MSESRVCQGHGQRIARVSKIKKFLESRSETPVDESLRVLIKKGPTSIETSLRELEETYASKPEWRVIEDGGVLSVPVEEFRMVIPPKPDSAGNIKIANKKGGRAKYLIENYPVAQTIANLNDQILMKFNTEKQRAQAAGKSEASAESAAQAKAKELPEFTAVQKWLDIEAEIKLKRSFEAGLSHFEVPALIVRSVSLRALSALKDFGIILPKDAEIDLVMAFVSGDFLHVVICEVKRADTFPWQAEGSLPNKQAVNKAENQLTKDVDVLMAILAGIPSSQIKLYTLACFPDASTLELQAIFCSSCLQTEIVCQEDLSDMSLLRRKTQVPDETNPATNSGKEKLLTLTARLLSSQSLLHVGFREVEDKETLVTERQKYNLESVDKKIAQREFVVASPQQQQVLSSFTASSFERHLVLKGPAGSGKTLVALQVAKNLIENTQKSSKVEVGEPILVVTALWEKTDNPLMKFLGTSFVEIKTPKIFKGWNEFGVQHLKKDRQLLRMTESLANEYQGRQIVVLVDEIDSRGMMANLADQVFPESVRMILVLNPVLSRSLTTLPSHFLCVTLTTPYRSTRAITSLAQFISKCHGRVVPEGDFGSDVEGITPILFDVGNDERKMVEVLDYCRRELTDKGTILFDLKVPPQIKKKVEEHLNRAGGSWDCHEARNFFGWEAENVVAVISGGYTLEQITRARTRLFVVLVEGTGYAETKEYFKKAGDNGLVLMINVNQSDCCASKCTDQSYLEVDTDFYGEYNIRRIQEYKNTRIQEYNINFRHQHDMNVIKVVGRREKK